MKKKVLRELLRNREKEVLNAKTEEFAPKIKPTRKNASKKGEK